MRNVRNVKRALVGLTTAAVLGSSALTAPAHALSPRADRAADWIVGGLQGGLLYTSYEGVDYPNHGTTLDAALAFQALKTRGPARRQILAAFKADPDAYVAEFGGGDSAGALGKLLTVVQQQGIRPDAFYDGLDERLEARITPDGQDAGRATEDYPNAIKQSLAVRALAMSKSTLADETTRFLIKQQCAGGYFRLLMVSSDGTCDGGTPDQSGASVDTTAFAVLALLQVRKSRTPGVQRMAQQSLDKAERWLVRAQARNGSYGDDGVQNSNSTGMAAEALKRLGRHKPARRAAVWVSKLQVTPKHARTTALTKGDVGAIAFTRSDLEDAKTNGFPEDALYYWQSSTAQAAFSQGLL